MCVAEKTEGCAEGRVIDLVIRPHQVHWISDSHRHSENLLGSVPKAVQHGPATRQHHPGCKLVVHPYSLGDPGNPIQKLVTACLNDPANQLPLDRPFRDLNQPL